MSHCCFLVVLLLFTASSLRATVRCDCTEATGACNERDVMFLGVLLELSGHHLPYTHHIPIIYPSFPTQIHWVYGRYMMGI